MLLSGGIVDPDWGNTSQNYHNIVPIDDIELRPKARLKHLDAYVKGLGNKRDKRSRLRREVYKKSRTCNKMDPMLLCELPVGVGKATATMATILKIAAKEGLDRIFVVQPFTTIIDQTVDVYRKALTLPDEDCNNKRIIAAHHHRVDYENEACRQYAATWSSPIVVTTAVQFFETLASNQPSALRKLHHVPGSLIIIDEFHCALPSHLLQLAWGWLKELVEKWSCHVLFSSGSSIRFWEMEEFAGETEKIRSIVPVSLFDKAIKQEKLRVEPRFWNKRHSIRSLCEWALNSEGPRVIVLNTVQSSAVIARYLIRKEGNSKVEHISNGLNPIHREAALARVKERLKDKGDTDWTLVATSCVESGLNLSFRTGFCEERSLMSALQIAGRINRDNEYKTAVLHVFCLAYNRYLREHPAFNTARAVLREMFKQKKVSPEYCTEAFEREVHRRSSSVAMKKLAKDEKALQFKDVAAGFQIIAGGTMTVVLPEMAERLRRGEKVNWWEIQDNSIQVWEKNAQKWGVTPIFGFEEISEWTLGYDSKLGIMAGILPLIDAERKNIFII
jgi:CRISPR-associated endonuclease/helicase Cas3